MSDIIEQDINLPRTTFIQVTLDELYENPINLNTASYDEILKIPYLTPILAQSIFEYAYKKRFSSKFDLLRIRGIDAELFDKIRPLVIVKSDTVKPKIKYQLTSKFSIDTLNNLMNIYRWSITNKIKLSFLSKDNELKLTVLTDKDDKENKITDFLSVSASIKAKNNRLVLGDYLLNFGAGLIFTGPFSYLNSTKNFSLDPLKSINENTGIYENISLFGAVVSHSVSNFVVHLLMSSSLLDAAVENNIVKRIYYYTNYTDSLSKARRDQLRENLIGLRMSYSPMKIGQDIIIGTTFYHNQYDKNFTPTDSQNSIYGSNLSLLGFDIQSRLGSYFFNSEIGYSITHGFGGAMHIIGDWQFFKVNFNVYSQQKNFFSPHSKWRELTNRKDKINSTFNIFYNISGFKMYLLASTKQDFSTDSLPARIRYQIERKQGLFNIRLSLKGNYQDAVLHTYGTRFDVSYQLVRNLVLIANIEDNYLKNEQKSGRLLSMGIRGHNNIVTTELHFYYFNINSSECRIYYSEPDRNSFTFNNKGIRLFCYLDCKIRNRLRVNYYIGYTKINTSNIDTGMRIYLDL